MREILFRGKDKDDGNWYEGYYLQLHDTTYCCMPSDNVDEANRLNKENEHHYIVFEQMTDWGLPNKHLRAEVLPETVCQYTGLTDKNGRKIFEGDIVKVLYTNGQEDGGDVTEVKYSEKSASFSPWDWEYDCDGCDLYFHIKEIEIVGNAFDKE